MTVINRLIAGLAILTACLVILGGCTNAPPEIKTTIRLSGITQKEYNRIGDTSKPDGITITDLRKLNVHAKINNSKKADQRTIIIPGIAGKMNSYDRVRVCTAGTYERNNVGVESYAESESYIIFDSRDLTEQDIRKLFRDSEVFTRYVIKHSSTSSTTREEWTSIGDELTVEQHISLLGLINVFMAYMEKKEQQVIW